MSLGFRQSILYAGATAPPTLPCVDHYAGTEKFALKALALQNQMAQAGSAQFDITLDCEDGAAIGREAAQAQMLAALLGSPENRFNRVGVRIHDVRHAHWQQDLSLILPSAAGRIAYIMLPKTENVEDVTKQCGVINQIARANGWDTPIPIHVLIETHAAVRTVWEIAAHPQVESLSFGLMDFVSSHHGAIPDAAMRSPAQFTHPLIVRAKVAIAAACHAHGKVPAHNVTTDIRHPAQAGADARRAREEFGYTRMWSIHPGQIAEILAIFTPTSDAVQEASAILLAAQAADWGPIQYAGRLHDRASFRYYWTTLERARSLGVDLPPTLEALFATEKTL